MVWIDRSVFLRGLGGAIGISVGSALYALGAPKTFHFDAFRVGFTMLAAFSVGLNFAFLTAWFVASAPPRHQPGAEASTNAGIGIDESVENVPIEEGIAKGAPWIESRRQAAEFGQTLVAAIEFTGARDEKLAPVRSRIERRERGLERRQHLGRRIETQTP
jgi:hypothetical protein